MLHGKQKFVKVSNSYNAKLPIVKSGSKCQSIPFEGKQLALQHKPMKQALYYDANVSTSGSSTVSFCRAAPIFIRSNAFPLAHKTIWTTDGSSAICETNGFEESDHESSDDEKVVIADYIRNKRLKIAEKVQRFIIAVECLTVEQLQDSMMRFLCPICLGDRGVSKRYKLLLLLSHMKSSQFGRKRSHNLLAKRLERILQSRGVSTLPRLHSYMLWKLFGDILDHEIVWPPMIVVLNTRSDIKDVDDKWLGMSDEELLTFFYDYPAIKAHQSYGSNDHRGISVLMFESNPNGYYAAECLHNEFIKRKLDRDAWNSGCLYSEGVQQLHSYYAKK